MGTDQCTQQMNHQGIPMGQELELVLALEMVSASVSASVSEMV